MIQIVQRVHWIRAWVQKQRWKEELILVGYEMQWMVSYYKHQATIWDARGKRAQDAGNAGATAYVACKSAMWQDMAAVAEKRFRDVCWVVPAGYKDIDISFDGHTYLTYLLLFGEMLIFLGLLIILYFEYNVYPLFIH